MTKIRHTVNPVRCLLALLAAAALCLTSASDVRALDEASRSPAKVSAAFGHLPLAFESNRGQADDSVSYIARGRGYALLLTPTETVLILGQDGTPATVSHADVIDPLHLGGAPGAHGKDVVRLRFLDANPRPTISGHSPLPGRVHYLIGRDPSRWHTDVPVFAEVHYGSVYPGIDVRYYGSQGRLEYDVIVSPGADASQVRLEFSGTRGISLAQDGTLLLDTGSGELRQLKPIVYQVVAGERRAVDGRFVVAGDGVVHFALGAYNPSLALVIDPVLEYATYLGGRRWDEAHGIATDTDGAAYITGWTASVDFPTLDARQDLFAGGLTDAFVTKLSSDGQAFEFTTYIGGRRTDVARAVAVDDSGAAYVTGYTESRWSFPLIQPVQPDLLGRRDGFVLKLSPSGDSLDYATYLGGTARDQGNGIAVDANGRASIVGTTWSRRQFPLINALQPDYRGWGDGFITQLDATGTAFTFSTYFGGTGNDQARGVGVDGVGDIYVTGLTYSRNQFPLHQALQPGFGGARDAFVAKLWGDGSALLYSTYLGGRLGDTGLGIAIDEIGRAHVAGHTDSRNDFPTANAQQTDHGGSRDAFVAQLSADGQDLGFSTYLGGGRFEEAHGIALDASGNVHVTGVTWSSDFPTVDALQSRREGYADAFVSRYSPDGTTLDFSTYLGGNLGELGRAIAIDTQGNALIAGYTGSRKGFPLVDPLQAQIGGGVYDAFVAKLAFNQPPQITSTPILAAIVGQSYSYDAEADDPEADDLTFALVTFPAGMTIDPITGLVSWIPGIPGDFDVEIEVSDIHGGSDTQAFVIAVAPPNAPPVITSVAPIEGAVGAPYQYDVEANDPDGDPLSYLLNAAPPGMVIDEVTGQIDWTPNSPGDFPVVVRAADPAGASDTQSFTIMVTDDSVAPVITITSPADGTITGESTLTVTGFLDEEADLLLNGVPVDVQSDLTFSTTIDLIPGNSLWTLMATDAAGNSAMASFNVTLVTVLTITSAPVVSAPAGVQYRYDVEAFDPGGGLLSFSLNDAPLGMNIGTVSGLVTWTPPAKGMFDVSIEVTNGFGASDTQVYVLEVPNRAPVIVSTPPVDTRLGEAYSYDVDALDSDADILQFSLLAAPASMTIDPGSGRIAWVVDETGSANVSVRVDDGDGGLATQSYVLTIENANRAPVIDSTPVTGASVDASYEYLLSATDADGDPLGYSLTTAPVGMHIDPVSGRITWIPGTAGVFPVSATADDGHGGMAMQAFDVTVSYAPGAQPPGLAPIGDQIAALGSTLSLQLSATDADGNPLRFLADPLPLAANMRLDAVSGEFTFTPVPSQVGDHEITFIASDGRFSDSETVTLTVPAPGGTTTLTGRVLTTGAAPLANVTLAIADKVVLSDSNGDYFFDDLPVAGTVRLLIDGSTVDPALGVFATVPEMIPIIAGADNRLEPAIVLLPLDVASADPVVPSQTSVITSSRPVVGLEIFEPVTLTIPPGAAQLSDGSPFAGDIHISRVADPTQGPRPLPPDIDLSFYIAIQPFGVVYPTPVPVSFPNIEHLPPESILDIFALNHDTGAFEKIGEGRVSVDGKTVDSIGGVVQSNSWHGIVPQAPVNSPANDPGQGNLPPNDDTKCPACRFNLETGNLGEDHSLPLYYSLGAARGVRLSYNSLNANPRPIINVTSQFGNFSPPPLSMSMRLAVDGIDQGFEPFMETKVVPSAIRGQFESTRPSVQFEAGMLTTGIHDYALTVNCHFPVSRRSETLFGTTVVQNERTSPFGAGWTFAGLQRLHLHADGTVLLSQGDGTALVFVPDPADLSGDSYISPAGDFSVLARQPGGEFTRRMKDGMVYTFDTDGLQSAAADRNGNTTTYVYDSGDRLMRVVDPVGSAFEFTYFADRIESIADPLGRTTRFEHDAEGNLIRIIEPNGDSRRFEYQEHTNLMIAQLDQRNNRSEYSYDFAGRLVGALLPDGSTPLLAAGSTDGVLDPASGTGTGKNDLAPPPSLAKDVENMFTDANGNVERTETDALSARVKHLDAVGRLTLNERDADALPTETTRPNASQITRTFDLLGNPTLVREDFNGAEYRYEYDPHSLVTRYTNPNDHITTITRDARGNAEAIVNHLGHTSTFEYDSRGLVTRSVSPNGLVTVMLYNAMGLVATQTETPPIASPGNVRVTRFTYDAAGQLIRLVSPDGVTTDLTYDDKGRLIRIADNLGQAVVYVYDAFNNLIQTEVLNGDTSPALRVDRAFDTRNRLVELRAPHVSSEESITQRTLDNNSNLTGLIDPNSNLSSNRFDAEDRLIENTHREGGVSTYTYDTNDRITEVVAPNGVTTTYTYDVLGRRLTESSPDRGLITYEYDLANNVTSITEGRGITATFTYDELERPLTKTFPNTIPGKIEDVAYTYDTCPFGIGYLCARSDESGDYSYEYDAFGNVTHMEFVEAGGVTYTMDYTYDDGDNVLHTTYPSGRQVDFTRDALRRVEAIDSTVNGTARTIVSGIRYRADNQPTRRLYGNGLSDSRTYDLQGRLTEQRLETLTGFVVDERIYTYDKNSNILAIDTNFEDNAYAYDRRDRLTSDQVDTTIPLDFDYDLNDNRLSHFTADSSRLADYFYADDSNRLTRLNEFQAGAPLPASPRRDLVYNDAGRLFEIWEGGILVSRYLYNDEGQRTRKTVFDAGGSVQSITIFHYDHSGYLITETTELGELVKDYLWLEGMVPVAQIDSIAGFEAVNYLHTDHLMTNRLASDDAQQVIWRWEGEAFGATQAQGVGGTSVNLRFPGQYFDEETGLHYNWNRYFDPEIGRYITSDPVGLNAGLNSYAYANVNPIGAVDPNGEIIPVLIWAGFALYTAAEVALSAYDAYDTARTLLDPCESAAAKATAVGLMAIGIVAPGGGYGQVRHLPVEQIARGAANPKIRAAAARGRQAHKEFAERVKAKDGWRSEPQDLIDPATGRKVVPDAITPSGRPIELKPNTPSGRKLGRSQLRKYERATGKKGKVIYYDP